MSTIFGVLTLIVAVVIANVCHLIFPRLPLSIYQIIIGILLALWPSISTFTLEPETFLLLIIAPLMFNDGQNASYRELTKNVKPILSMTIYLAVFTVLVTGLGLHFAAPAFTLPLAFMLAAIITPTDAVAVKSLTTGVAMPKNVHQTLEQESLFNDASGLVLFSLALSSLASGSFSLAHSVATFAYVFLGGIVLGTFMGWLLISLRFLLMRNNVDIGQIVIPINLMTPVVVYWLAEEIHCSGILAVVAAGVTHSMMNDRLRLTSAKIQIATTTIWQITAAILNGIVFVFLGLSLPEVLKATTPQGFGSLVLLAICLYLLTAGIRYLWARLNLVDLKNPEQQRSDALLLAIGGIHGTITLAMAFSIPTSVNGHPLALRNTMILVAALVILISITVGTIGFPRLLPKKQLSYSQAEFHDQLVAAVQFAIDRLNDEQEHRRERVAITDQLISQMTLTYQIDGEAYRKLLNACYEVEMKQLDQLNENGEIATLTQNAYFRFITAHMRNHSQTGVRSVLSAWSHRLKWYWFRRLAKHKQQPRRLNVSKQALAAREEMRHLVAQNVWAVNDYLNSVQTPDNVNEVNMVRRMYLNRIRTFNRRQRLDQEVIHQLSVAAFQDEHSYVQQSLAAGRINAELAKALNEHISIDELVYLQSN